MSRRLKELVTKELSEKLAGVKSCVLVGYRGLSAQQMDDLRKAFSQKQARMQVIKNSLAAIALEKVGMADLKAYLQGPTALVRGGDDTAALAKTVAECTKKYEGIKISGGFGEGVAYNAAQVKALSIIPPREMLYARMLGLINSPMSALAGAFNCIQRSLACALQAIKEKMEKEAPPPAPEPAVATAAAPEKPAEAKAEAKTEAPPPAPEPAAVAAAAPEKPAEPKAEAKAEAPAQAPEPAAAATPPPAAAPAPEKPAEPKPTEGGETPKTA